MCLLTLCVESLTKSKKTVNVAVPGARRASRYARTAPNRAFGHSARRAYPECLRRLPPVGRGRKQAVQEFGHRERVLAGFEKGAGGLRLHVPALPAPGADRLAPRVGLLPAKGERGVPWSAGGGEDPPGDQPGDPGDGKGPARVLPVVEGSRAGRFSRRKPGARVRGVRSGTIRTDEVVAAAVLDRLLHRCHLAKIRGDSYRMRQRGDLAQPLRQVLARKTPGPGPVTQAETPR